MLTKDFTDIFLVDAPFEGVTSGPWLTNLPSLHIPAAHSRGGLTLSPLLEKSESSLFGCLKQFFSHGWQLQMMKDRKLSSTAFFWLLAASAWRYNTRYLKQSISDVAFKDVRHSDLQGSVGHKVHDRLQELKHNHELQHSLMDLRQEVEYAKKYLPREINNELHGAAPAPDGFFEDILEEILGEVEAVDRFLVDTFQLLMGSISILDSATSIQQARSSQKLTQLAFIFIPLNLVTSIFGMNIMEINGSPVRAWVCVVVLVVAIACTASLLMAYDRWETRRQGWNFRTLGRHLVSWTRRRKLEDNLQP